MAVLTETMVSLYLAPAIRGRYDKAQARTIYPVARRQERRRADTHGEHSAMADYFFQLVMSSTLTSYFAIFATASFCASSSTLLNASASL